MRATDAWGDGSRRATVSMHSPVYHFNLLTPSQPLWRTNSKRRSSPSNKPSSTCSKTPSTTTANSPAPTWPNSSPLPIPPATAHSKPCARPNNASDPTIAPRARLPPSAPSPLPNAHPPPSSTAQTSSSAATASTCNTCKTNPSPRPSPPAHHVNAPRAACTSTSPPTTSG